ncbi:MAG: exodeoxyribonuclease VII large subunit [Bacteroidia bacterium]|nr:exodeoxyribonuclease VII large subunit [Bacteroidia bacterium]
MAKQAYTVSECTWHIKRLLENDPALQEVRVMGEVSNLTYHRSGHVYFTIKDAQAQLSCVMFQGDAVRAPQMQAGDEATFTGFITVYAPRGNYQMRVVKVEKQGLGDLFQQFVALKEKLASEGLFDPSIKKRLPRYPKHIAMITSPTGAAIQDMLRTLQRRYPVVRVTVIPTVVQGSSGAASIVSSLSRAQEIDADLVILARGGGSLEDLWNFNEEAVARAIRASKIPVITGVGHETDVTIADFAADMRTSTPTAAAEHAVPDRDDLLDRLAGAEEQVNRSLRYFIDFKRQMLDEYSLRFEQAVRQYLRDKRHELDLIQSKMQGLDQRALLERGYSLTLKDGVILSSKEHLAPGDVIDTLFKDGRVRSTISDILPQEDGNNG